MKIYSRHHWNYVLTIFQARFVIQKNPNLLSQLSTIEELVIFNYLNNKGWAFSVSLAQVTKLPDHLIVDGFDENHKILVWTKPIKILENRLSTEEYKTLSMLAGKNQYTPGYFLIKSVPVKLVMWLTCNRFVCHWVVFSRLWMF